MQNRNGRKLDASNCQKIRAIFFVQVAQILGRFFVQLAQRMRKSARFRRWRAEEKRLLFKRRKKNIYC